ncbi:MAG: hypothetical protein GY851_22850 [bacterium]|nr:hypothetical protein [bacterium]
MSAILAICGIVFSQPYEFDLATYPQVDGSTMTADVSTCMACAHFGIRALWKPEQTRGQHDGIIAGPAGGRPLLLRDEASVWIESYYPPDLGHSGRYTRCQADESPPETYRVARAINALFSGHRGLPKAMDSFVEGDVELLLLVGEPMPDDHAGARMRGFGLDCVPIARDALVFLANTENPTTDITTAQVRDAYQRKLGNWNVMGGPDEPLRPYQARQDSTCWRVMKRLLLKDAVVELPGDMDEQSLSDYKEWWLRGRSHFPITDLWRPLRDGMRRDTYGLFCAPFQCLPDLRTLKLKPLAIDGVAPSVDTIRSGEYPYIVTVNAIVRSDSPPDSGARRLREWLLAPAGQEALEKCGFVPLDNGK